MSSDDLFTPEQQKRASKAKEKYRMGEIDEYELAEQMRSLWLNWEYEARANKLTKEQKPHKPAYLWSATHNVKPPVDP